MIDQLTVYSEFIHVNICVIDFYMDFLYFYAFNQILQDL